MFGSGKLGAGQLLTSLVVLALGAALALLVPAYPVDFTVAVISSTPSRVEPILAGRHPAATPDGTGLVYDDASGLWLHADNARAPLLLASTREGVVQDAAWSPQGNRLVWVQSVAGQVGLSVFDMETNAISPLVSPDHQAVYLHPAWSPTGDWIAFTRLGLSADLSAGPATTADRSIWLVRPDGSELHYVTQGECPAWSPDGRLLAFQRAGSVLRIPRFTNAQDPVDFFRLELPEIWVMEPGTDTARRLTTGGEPSWSPDGRHLAFIDYRVSLEHKLQSLAGAFRLVAELAIRSVPAEVPSSELFQVASPTVASDSTVYRELWVIELGTGNRHRLTDAQAPLPTPGESGYTLAAMVASDLQGADPNYGLHAEYDPSWSRDGRKLYFSAYLRTLGTFFVYSTSFVR